MINDLKIASPRSSEYMLFTSWEVKKYFVEVSKTARGRGTF